MATRKANIGAYITRFKGRMTTFQRGVLIKLYGSVIKDTPVLTGRLRGNWTFGLGEPPTTFNDGTGDPTGKVVGEVRSQVKGQDGKFYLANSMPYCNRIEFLGWSKVKAPQGMVRKNILRIANILSEEAGKL